MFPFQRFQNLKRNKWEHKISFPTHINLSPYCEEIKVAQGQDEDDNSSENVNEFPKRKIRKIGKQSEFSSRLLNSRSLTLKAELHFEEYL
jgi:hypothetical protein